MGDPSFLLHGLMDYSDVVSSCSLYYFPVAALTNDHQQSGLKLTLSQSWRPAVLNQGVDMAVFPLKALENPASPLQASGSPRRLVATSLHSPPLS